MTCVYLLEQRLDSGLRETPCTSVERFLLTPDNGLGVGIHIQVFFQQLPWEGVQLFYTSDGGIFQAIVCTMLVERSIDLTTAEDDTVNLCRLVDGLAVLRVWDDPLEL